MTYISSLPLASLTLFRSQLDFFFLFRQMCVDKMAQFLSVRDTTYRNVGPFKCPNFSLSHVLIPCLCLSSSSPYSLQVSETTITITRSLASARGVFGRERRGRTTPYYFLGNDPLWEFLLTFHSRVFGVPHFVTSPHTFCHFVPSTSTPFPF